MQGGREGSEKEGEVQWNMKHLGKAQWHKPFRTDVLQLSFSEVVASPISSLFPDLHVKYAE